MTRYCFTMQLDPDQIETYRERHAHVWPEMLQALHDNDWRNYSIFLRPDGLVVGYVESDDLVAAQAKMAELDVNRRWQAEMSRLFAGLNGAPPDENFIYLTEIFNLDEQLGRARGGGPRSLDESTDRHGQ